MTDRMTTAAWMVFGVAPLSRSGLAGHAFTLPSSSLNTEVFRSGGLCRTVGCSTPQMECAVALIGCPDCVCRLRHCYRKSNPEIYLHKKKQDKVFGKDLLSA